MHADLSFAFCIIIALDKKCIQIDRFLILEWCSVVLSHGGNSSEYCNIHFCEEQWKVQDNLFITLFLITWFWISQFKDGAQKCLY